MPTKKREILKYEPEQLGMRIDDVPEPILSNSSWSWISEGHHLLFCGTDEGDLFTYDMKTKKWLKPLHPKDLDSIENVFATKDHLFVSGFGPYHVYSLPNFKFQTILYHETGGWAGVSFNDMALIPSSDDQLGVDLVSINPEEIRQKYRLPQNATKFNEYRIETINHNNTHIAAFVANGENSHFLLWDAKTSKFLGNFPARWDDFQGPLLSNDHLADGNVLVNLQDIESTKDLGDFMVMGFVDNQVFTYKSDDDECEDKYLRIYQLPDLHEIKEIIIADCELHQISFSPKYILLERSSYDPPYFVLVNLEEMSRNIDTQSN